eukprot:scaffold299877_cov33-Prasinocladus_malaysianus.AAC.1
MDGRRTLKGLQLTYILWHCIKPRTVCGAPVYIVATRHGLMDAMTGMPVDDRALVDINAYFLVAPGFTRQA